MTHPLPSTRHPGHDHGREHAHGRPHGGPTEGLAELLDLDAAVLGSYLGEATLWASALAAAPPRMVVDLGAGTGVGAFALTARFPSADVVALDRTATMLRRIEHTARVMASAERVRILEADVDVAWPALGPVDLVWSSSTLHEVADPGRVLGDVRTALRPGGLVVILESDGPARFAFGPAVGLEPAFEARLRDAERTLRGDAEVDWGLPLAEAGLSLVDRRTFTATARPGSPGVGRYARLYLERIRLGLQERLGAPDLATLDALLAARGADAPLSSGNVTIRTTRTAWAARRP